MIKKIISKTKTLLTLFFILFLYSNCSLQDYAPRTIEGYKIQIMTTKASNEDKAFLGRDATYNFQEDGTYSLTLNGKLDSSGDYSYKRTGRNKGSVILAYDDPKGELTYNLDLTFISPTMGNWKDSYSLHNFMSESGTFTILKREHPLKK